MKDETVPDEMKVSKNGTKTKTKIGLDDCHECIYKDFKNSVCLFCVAAIGLGYHYR